MSDGRNKVQIDNGNDSGEDNKKEKDTKEKYETDIVWYLSYVKNTFLEVLIITYGSHNELVYSTEH